MFKPCTLHETINFTGMQDE
jgi:hypothetical protein